MATNAVLTGRRRSGEVVSLAERLRYMQLFRVIAIAISLSIVLLVDGVIAFDSDSFLIGNLMFLMISAAAELLWRILDRRGLGLFSSMLIVDGVFLAWVTWATGGPSGALAPIVAVHLVAVTLLASYRTGLKLGLWHSLLVIVVHEAQESSWLERLDGGIAFGTAYEQLVLFIILLWLVGLATAAFSAVNERELRRRRFDLEALASFATALESAKSPRGIARQLLTDLEDNFEIARSIVISDATGPCVVLAQQGVDVPQILEELGDESIVAEARRSTETLLYDGLDADEDRGLTDAFGADALIVAVPLRADGGALGMLIAEHPAVRGIRIERRVVSILERFASHAALSLRNAWLVEQLEEDASTDALTGLANRRTFDDEFARELERASRNGDEVSLVLLDIDHFKALNDGFGHQTGDRILREVGRQLSESCRDFEQVARYGGEEFIAILTSCDADEALIASERLRKAMAVNDGEVAITASAGVATFPTHGDDARSLLRAADAALYASKRAGRNRSTLAPAELSASA